MPMPKKTKRNPLEKLHKHWQRASMTERRLFLEHVRTQAGHEGSDGSLSPQQDAEALIANGRYLLPTTVTRIEHIMISRRIGPDEIMREAGFADQGMALTRALVRQASLRLSVIDALRIWIIKSETDLICKNKGGTG